MALQDVRAINFGKHMHKALSITNKKAWELLVVLFDARDGFVVVEMDIVIRHVLPK